MNPSPQVLIVGAGPTGLVLALCLARQGVRFRIIDKNDGPGTTSRALVVHARTLEFYRQLGIDEAVISAGQVFAGVNMWVDGTKRARLPFGDIGGNLSKYPFSLVFPQDEHEQLLVDALRKAGIDVERKTEMLDMEVRDGSIASRLRGPNGTGETCEFRYVAGCDGAHSIVREKSGISLPGGTYSHLWYVADVEATGPVTNHEINISIGADDFIAVFPMKGDGRARLVGQAPAPRPDGTATWDDVSKRPLQELRTDVTKVNWFSTYRVHHRVASTFSQGPVFLLGDAAHLHSPVGGQGMNTGIGDAVNLAWKLAAVLLQGASPGLLESYAPERTGFARRLVATTDRVFTLINSGGMAASLFRTVVIPRILSPLFHTQVGRRAAFRLVSQISIRYRSSVLSEGRAGGVHGGDRLPWVPTPGDRNGFGDNFAPLDMKSWQAHVYGAPAPALRRLCEARRIPLHVFEWQSAMRSTGLSRNAVYLIRPDQHVAFVGPGGKERRLERYLEKSFAFAAVPPSRFSGSDSR